MAMLKESIDFAKLSSSLRVAVKQSYKVSLLEISALLPMSLKFDIII